MYATNSICTIHPTPPRCTNQIWVFIILVLQIFFSQLFDHLCVPRLSPPPLTLSIPPNQTLCPNQIALSQQLRHIDIKRGLRFRARQQLVYRSEGRGDGVSGGPRGFEEIETDFPGLEINVGVADWGDEFDGGRG